MRNAKLWSVLLAAVLLCACIAGVLFTGASASDSRIPTATTTYVVGTDGDTIRACLDKAAGETWGKDTVLEIQFSGEDKSIYSAPDAANGVSGYTMFETATIFREDDTQLPIVIRGLDDDRAAKIMTPSNSYNATNDYFFTNLTMNGGASASATVSFYAGSGELVFENTKHNNYSYTWYYGDCQATDAWEGWDAAKIAANKGDKNLVETGIVFGNGTKFFDDFADDASDEYQRMSAVGFNGANNETIAALKRAEADVTAALTEDEVEAVREAAKTATYRKGNVVEIADCPVKPWDTQAYLVLDSGTENPTSYEYGYAGARKGISPVQEAKIEAISGGYQYLSADGHDSQMNETYVGNTTVIVRGGKTLSNSVGIRLTNVAMLVGDLKLEIHQDNENVPTQTKFVQPGTTGATSTVFGNYHFLMTGGTIGAGYSNAKVDSNGDQAVDSNNKKQWNYNDSNDGYWGAPVATGTIVNEVQGGQIWQFYSSRYANTYENTPISIVLPGTNETLTAKVSVHNIISGGIIGGPEVQGTKTDSAGNVIDVQNGTKAYFGGAKAASTKITSVCNEILGGTIYDFRANGTSTGKSYMPDDVYNYVHGTKEKYPTFLCDFYGTRASGGYNITNIIKGYPKFNDGTSNRCIFGGTRNGTITRVTNYIGGMPQFKNFYGGSTGTSDKSSANAAVQYLHSYFAFDPETKIAGEIFAGNGYWQVKGLDGATASKGNSNNYVTYELEANVYSGNFGTFRLESVSGTDVKSGDNMTLNVYGGNWDGSFMPVNRIVSRTTSTYAEKSVTTNIYGGTFGGNAYMGGQNARNTNVINNIYGGEFKSNYYGGGDDWVKTVTNNIYGGTFSAAVYAGGYQCGSESIVNNIYGGTFSDSGDYMGAFAPATEDKNHNAGTIENNLYGGKLGSGWTYMGHRNGPAKTITNHFYDGADNPCRDPENALYKYYDEATMLPGGTHLRDQVMCGIGYNEQYVNINRVESITNTFEGGYWEKDLGAGADITYHGGMRWGIVGDITNNFVKGTFCKGYGGSDYGYVTGTITNNFGTELEEGAEAPALVFTDFTMGGGLDQSSNTQLMSEKIAAAKAATDPTETQQAWIAIAEEFGDDYEGGAKYIVNNVYYGTFADYHGGSYGSSEGKTLAVSKIDTITNNIYGGTFTEYHGGTYRNAKIATGVFNNIKGGQFNGAVYLGNTGTGTVTCPTITSTIDGGFGNESENASFYCGNGGVACDSVVKTTFNDFTANKTYVYGGSYGKHTQPENADYAIETTINGGTFIGFWGQGGGTNSDLTGNIKTTVNGGTFNGWNSLEHMHNAIAGGSRNGSTTGNIELIINGGTFNSDVVGGIIWGSQTNSDKLVDGNITVTVNGGTFNEDIYVDCRIEDGIEVTGTKTLNGVQTAGKALKLGGVAKFDSFISNGEAVDIDAETNVKFKTLTGKLHVNQTVGWQAHDYLTLPAGSEYDVAEAEGIYGSYFEDTDGDGTIFIVGNGMGIEGVTLRLGERIGVRVLLNKDDVDGFGDAFTYKVTFGEDETVLAEGTKADLVDYQGYYSFIYEGIGLAEFGQSATISGIFLNEIMDVSIAQLAEMAQTAWADNAKWKAYADAVVEFHNVYNLNAENTLTPAAVPHASDATKYDENVDNATATLLMADAAGVRLEVTFKEMPENVWIYVDGHQLDEQMITVEGNVLTADIYVAHEYMATTLTINVQSDTAPCMQYSTSIEILANELANATPTEDNAKQIANATAFLVYVQKAVACK